ncbi:MAG: hypothetical protein ABJC51_05955, partial [Acidobacteriota bacterium]
MSDKRLLARCVSPAWLLLAALSTGASPAPAGQAPPVKKPVVVAQMYVWVQEYQSHQQRLED